MADQVSIGIMTMRGSWHRLLENDSVISICRLKQVKGKHVYFLFD
jgi:hypothetical protein